MKAGRVPQRPTGAEPLRSNADASVRHSDPTQAETPANPAVSARATAPLDDMAKGGGGWTPASGRDSPGAELGGGSASVWAVAVSQAGSPTSTGALALALHSARVLDDGHLEGSPLNELTPGSMEVGIASVTSWAHAVMVAQGGTCSATEAHAVALALVQVFGRSSLVDELLGSASYDPG
jgi:hypothetical protein